MAADGIFNEFKHDIAAVGIKRMARGEQYGLRIIYCAAGRQVFSCVMKIIAEEVSNLFAFDIHYFKALPFFYNKGNAATRGDDV
jgi:hypothetical protein